MLGLLLLAGLGVAAAALVEHVDTSDAAEEPETDQPPEEDSSGDLLDDMPPLHDAGQDDAAPEDHAVQAQGDEAAGDEAAGNDGSEADTPADDMPPPQMPEGHDAAFPEGHSEDESPDADHDGAVDPALAAPADDPTSAEVDHGGSGATDSGATDPGAADHPVDALAAPHDGAETPAPDPTSADPTSADPVAADPGAADHPVDPLAAPHDGAETPAPDPTNADPTNADPTSADPGLAAQPAPVMAAPAVHNQYGTAGNDSLEGTTGRDFLEGRGGNDILQGRGGADHLVTFDAGSDTAWGGMGADSLHGYTVNAMPGGDTSFVIEDHAVDHLHGGLGADKLWLGSGDVGTGGAGSDEFHLSWDIDHGHPATITDYHPRTDRIVIEFTTNHADGDMNPITGAEQTVTTQPLHDGSGTAICLNGQPVANVLGTTTLRASDIAVVHL